MKKVNYLSSMIYYLSRALQGLKLLFDPAVEGNPYDSHGAESKQPKKRSFEQPRFGLRRRLVYRRF